MNKRPEKTENTRRKFADKFCELYEKKPIDRITVKEITDSLHYNRSTFYEYYTDIYELRDQLEDELADHIMEQITGAVRGGLLGDGFDDMFRELLNTTEHHAKEILFNKHDPHFAEKAIEKAVPAMQQVFGAQTGSRRAEYAARYHVAGIMYLARQLSSDSYGDKELAEAVRAILQDGVLAAVRG